MTATTIIARLAPNCHFRLSVVVTVARNQFLRAERGRKPQICRWNCHPICIVPVLGPQCHNAISGCWSLPQSLGDTLFSRKSRTCCWNIGAICRSSSAITISGFGGHLVISGCHLMFQSLVDTFSCSPWSKTTGLTSEL